MQILGKRSKILLIAVAIVMLVAIGVSFAMWDLTTVKATNGDLSTYANAKIGETVMFGNYYQFEQKDVSGDYLKTPIEWLVVDKDERCGQLTLMSKYILASGSYFGNYYYNSSGGGGFHYNTSNTQTAGIAYNQAYVDSTVRAFLNNLERKDLGGDSYSTDEGYKTSVLESVKEKALYTSVGFSNRKCNFSNEFQRILTNPEFKARPATRGFYDEAFSNDEKAMIMPKTIAGYTGHRWPSNSYEPTTMTYVESVVDKVWLPSAAELNNIESGDQYTNPSDAAGSTVFEYFKSKTGTTLNDALKTTLTELAKNSFAMNYSIPLYKYQSTELNDDDIHESKNATATYWTRSPVSSNYSNVRYISSLGSFYGTSTQNSDIGVRPCVILKY